MPGLVFQALLNDAGVPLRDVKLLRHKPRGIVDPFPIWRTDRAKFDAYQSIQRRSRRSYFQARVWASFATVPGSKTIFLGLYAAELSGPVGAGEVDPLGGHALDPAEHDRYVVTPMEELTEFAGRLFIEWGDGTRSWVQNGTTEKPITELYTSYREPEFPGYLELIETLSAIPTLPTRWADLLRVARGVYLLTCPRTKEQYVGKADGSEGFWGRWMEYAATGHGGNVRLRSRERSDYQVSILEVAGSSAGAEDVWAMEARWKAKLQTREMGLNGN